MKKKMLFVMATIVAFALFVPSVMAATEEVSSTDDFAEKVASAASGDTLKLTGDVEVSVDVTINKELTLDLNGNDILLKSKKTLIVQGGKLTVTGEGTIKELSPYYAPIMVIGSTDVNDTNYSVVTVGKDVLLEGWSGVFVRQSSTDTAYGVNITMNGTIDTKEDEDESVGGGIYVNGKIKHTTNAPVITLGETAVIDALGDGIYAAGYAVWNINGATITGIEAGIAIKAGKFNITDGIITSTGEDLRPTESYNNGVNPSGAAIQIESNDKYAGNVELNISGGKFVSDNSVAIYEYLALGKEDDATDDTTVTAVKSISISGGTFESEMGNFDVSASFDTKNSEFVSGGTFSDGYVPDEYLATDEEYVVTGEGEVLLKDEAVIVDFYYVVDGKLLTDDEGEVITYGIPYKKGYKFSDEEIKELEEELKWLEDAVKEDYKDDGFVFLGLFSDKDGKNKVDLTKSFTEDTEWYFVIGEEAVEELPPKTGDVNLAILIGTILVGAAGAVIISKKRFAKSN